MANSKYRILAADDEPNILLSIKNCLPSDEFKVDVCASVDEAFEAISHHIYDCAIIDIRLGNNSGIDLFKRVKADGRELPFIFISGNASLNEAAESQKLGAYDFIEKPFSSAKLLVTIKNCLQLDKLKQQVSNLRDASNTDELIGHHSKMKQLKTEIEKVARTDAVVFIHGESGTGKELIARNIHSMSARKQQEFITVNCSAIPENLIDSALFGHVKGAFTGAVATKKGYFERAHNGTLFLDEIGDMPIAAQSSLLRVLENKEIQKVGAENSIPINVRVVVASHKNLKLAVENGVFREDLFYRISVIPIHSPPLRERINDLPELIEHISAKLCLKHGTPLKLISKSCIATLSKYQWPGNIRELTNTLERMIIMGGIELRSEDIPTDITNQRSTETYEQSLKIHKEEFERQLIIERLRAYSGNISQVARSLEIDRTNLHKKIKYLGIDKTTNYK